MAGVVVSWIAAVWMMAVGVCMALVPGRCLRVLARMGGSAAIHFGEMAIRAVVGLAFIGVADQARHPAVFGVIGWFLLVSAGVLAVLPRRWHSAYSVWWSDRIPPPVVRALSIVSIAAGGALVWSFA